MTFQKNQVMTMEPATITIPLDKDTAQIYATASAQKIKRKYSFC
jgi:hypothetical protein